MKYSTIGYLIVEGFRNVFKNKKSTMASLMIMCATMIIFGIFFIIGENINHIMTNIEAAQGMEVFIEYEATDEDINKLGEQIDAIEGVNTKQFISKEEAVNRMKKRFIGREELMAGYEENPIFACSYIITLTDLSLSSQVQEQILQLENVKNITSSDKTINTLIGLGNGIRVITFIILIILVLISIFIISNTIKITVHSRRKEISIMKYVGGTNGFIRAPFVVEGMVIGILAGILSIAIVGGAYNVIADKILSSDFTQLVELTLVSFKDMFNLIVIVYLALGIGIGAIGSAISMRKYLNV